MKLKSYREKRDFERTNEPKPVRGKSSKALRFSVQKHAARHLHYDLRLELDGVLLSWAIPKGPSLDPADKRLAVKVEDHPLDYIYFEGEIPKGNYGAGTVTVWDRGTYTAHGATSLTESKKILRAGLEKGHLEIVFDGEQLQGKFSLIQLKNSKDGKSWLLIKGKDDHVENQPVKKKPQRTKKPAWIPPMLATLIDKPFDSEEWLFEIKWDGYRTLAYVSKKDVQLYSRNHLSFNKLFESIAKELKTLKIDAILDGEVVVLDKDGISRFELIQNIRKGTQACYYYIFDLLYYDGQDLRDVPLMERKDLLRQLLKKVKSPYLQFSDHIENKGISFFEAAAKKHLEGIIGKKKNSLYVSKRSTDWVKIKTENRQEMVIGGFTEPKGSRKKFGALLLGIPSDEGLQYVGDVGTGFDEETLLAVHEKMSPLIQKQSPFTTTVKHPGKITWIKPKLVCEVSFTEWTVDHKLRHPVFHGLRKDKKVQEIKEEKAVSSKKVQSNEKETFTNLDKIFWKEEGYTKGDMIEYYRAVAPFILPYLKNHPLMMRRYPNGIDGPFFYQKNAESIPQWIHTALVEHDEKEVRYILIQDLATLLYVANLGSIELHPMNTEYKYLQKPEFLVVDLDPEDVPFKKLIETTLYVHDLLEQCEIPNFCKTSGSRGLHLYVPLHHKYPFEQTEPFAHLLAQIVSNQLPDIISLERSPKQRQNRIYIDYLQNLHGGRTMVAPYSLRAKPHATVSTPLLWKEVKASLDPTQFTIKTVPARLKKIGDPFKDTLGKGIDLRKALKNLEKFT